MLAACGGSVAVSKDDGGQGLAIGDGQLNFFVIEGQLSVSGYGLPQGVSVDVLGEDLGETSLLGVVGRGTIEADIDLWSKAAAIGPGKPEDWSTPVHVDVPVTVSVGGVTSEFELSVEADGIVSFALHTLAAGRRAPWAIAPDARGAYVVDAAGRRDIRGARSLADIRFIVTSNRFQTGTKDCSGYRDGSGNARGVEVRQYERELVIRDAAVDGVVASGRVPFLPGRCPTSATSTNGKIPVYDAEPDLDAERRWIAQNLP